LTSTIKSITDWARPIAETVIENDKSGLFSIFDYFISREDLTTLGIKHLGIPKLSEYINMVPEKWVPDESIPGITLDFMDGAIKERVRSGPFQIPMTDYTLTPEAFKDLKAICQKNFQQYGEKPAPKTVEKPVVETPAVETNTEVQTSIVDENEEIL
jgi:hypothetical protein